jgi:putative tricarboxylic transport membrane protein
MGAQSRPAAVCRAQGFRLGPDRLDVSRQCRRSRAGADHGADFASILRVPFAAVAPRIVVSCAIGAYAIQNAMFDIWLILGFGVVGYVFKKIGIPLAPFTLALVLGSRAGDAFRLSMIGSGGDMRVFWFRRIFDPLAPLTDPRLVWSNWLVGSITTLAIVLLFWPVLDKAFGRVGRLWRPAKAAV